MLKHVIELLIHWSSACKDSLDRQGARNAIVYEGAEPAGGKELQFKEPESQLQVEGGDDWVA